MSIDPTRPTSYQTRQLNKNKNQLPYQPNNHLIIKKKHQLIINQLISGQLTNQPTNSRPTN